MWNIIKAQCYQIKGDIITISGLIISLVLPFLGLFAEGVSINNLTGSMFAVTVMSLIPFILLIISLVFVPRIMGWDMNDRTINYEVMSGHSRAQVYFARFFTSVIWTFIASVIIVSIPILIFTAVNGWGSSVKTADFVTRAVVMMLPFFRWICELTLLTVLAKNSNTGMVLGFVIFEVMMIFYMILDEMLDVNIDVIFSSANLMSLSTISNSRNVLIDGNMVNVFDAVLKPSIIQNSAVISIAAGIFCIIVSFGIFKKRDM